MQLRARELAPLPLSTTGAASATSLGHGCYPFIAHHWSTWLTQRGVPSNGVPSGGDMSEPDRDPVGRNDSEILPASPAVNQVVIISSAPLRAFIAALSPALRAREEFTIIVDRRRADSENAARPAIERRRHPSVDAKVKTDGFAIVPLSPTYARPGVG